MADILIRGMEMPRTCQICRTARFDRIVGCEEFDKLSIAQRMYKRSETCPLLPLPEGHGRLGDLDKLEENLRMMATYQIGERQQGILGCCETIRMTKPIVPAEGGNADGN